MKRLNERFGSERITEIIAEVAHIIDAKVVDVSMLDYAPFGASSVVLINERVFHQAGKNMAFHMDKSHIAAHTHIDSGRHSHIASFRIDIEVSTCGMISPLRALDFLIESFKSDIVLIDYRTRGFTRDVGGKKIFSDNEIRSIQEFISDELLLAYLAFDVNLYNASILHTRMMARNVDHSHIVSTNSVPKNGKLASRAFECLHREICDIFNGVDRQKKQ
ncbi:MAG: S-adenosylmethionine decarboxylase [Chitinispirillaceae bacterium]|nr:S-adenosylmethionine decarboxylase [Chitinispirillaceae bacterium]